MIELIKEWAGVAVLVAGSFWGIAEVYFKWRKAGESTKQETQTTQQSKLATEEKSLDLDHRRVEAAEEVASKSVEQLAERSEENLILMDKEYNARKEIIQLKHRVSALEDALSFIKDYVCFEEDCSKRRPPIGTYRPKCMRGAENGK